jgi:glutaconate CoA-transferase subunit B
MAVRAAHELRDGEVVFVGIGLPNLACNLARATHAPNLVLIYESGAVGAVPQRLPVSIGDPALVTGSLAVATMADVFGFYLQGGRIQVGFLGGAQIDRYGNINSTVIGPYDHPKVRLPGSGGACEIAIHAQRVIVVAPLSPRTFPAAVDFITSPGLNGKYGSRQKLGLPGKGPARIVTDLGILQPSARDGELELVAIYPGVTPATVVEQAGWPLRTAPSLQELPPPTPAELHLLREVLDPDHLYVGKRDA